MVASSRPLIICLSSTDWGFLRYRKQQLMERLSRRADVVFVNPPRALRSSEWPFRPRTQQLSPSLWVHEPFVMPGMRVSGIARQITYRWLAARLARWRQNRQLVLWLYSPHGLALVDLLKPDRLVYDICDLHATPSGRALRDEGERREIEQRAALEHALLARADLTLCVSEALVEWVGQRSRRVQLVPNGCEWQHYTTPPPAVAQSRQTRIGYVGTLAPRFDVELVAAVAKARPDWTIELVGPVLPLVDVSLLQLLPNVELTGEIAFNDVATKLATFDVCLLPLREIDFAYYCSPIQVFDYLAAGKPVVSTPVGQLERFDGLVHVVGGARAVADAVERALSERTPEHVASRRVFAARNTWDIRVAHIAEALDDIGISLPPAEAGPLREPFADRETAA